MSRLISSPWIYEWLQNNSLMYGSVWKVVMGWWYISSRVNSAFLDRLEARGSGTASESLPCTPELGNVWQMEEPQDPASSPVSFPSQLHTDSAAVEGNSDLCARHWACLVLGVSKLFFVILSIATSPCIKTQFVSCDWCCAELCLPFPILFFVKHR